MENFIKNICRKRKIVKGTTFIELLFYISIFLVLTPILLSVAINSLNTNQQYTVEREVNSDSQFAAERIYDLIAQAKRVDLNDSLLNDENGKLSLIMQDDSSVIIELNPETQTIELTENGITASLTSSENKFEQLYFEKIEDNLKDPEIALGINIRIKSSGQEINSIKQDYNLSGNLEKGDYDGDQCPDELDAYPRHPECCGDGDSDGRCDELDNCILTYNPFQEDYDTDGIGDSCDVAAFLTGGNNTNTQALGAFNCSPDEDLLELIYADPPTPSSTLKSILLSSSPLSPDVLLALEDTYPLMTNGHFLQVILNNMALPEDIYDTIIALDLPSGHAQQIQTAQQNATGTPAYIYHNAVTNYRLTFSSDAPEEENWTNRVRFHTPDYPLCANDILDKTDIFVLDVENGSDNITITTEAGSTEVLNLSTTSNYLINNEGFAIEFNEKVGNAYAILISTDSCDDELSAIEIDFGSGANILSPSTSATNYDAVRYTSYCEGGCDSNCGDIGSGIATSNILNSSCYDAEEDYPEWCSYWYTFENDDTENPAFIGGTQEGPETLYWESTFKSIINELQLEYLESITVTGEIAFQNITQFFCDTLANSCPMEGTLEGFQDIELYNFSTNSWVNIGTTGASSSTSDQQSFEVTYNGTDVADFIGGSGNEQIKARLEFNWNGEPSEGEDAPSFMLIDYFTVHLKW